jgi:hypothetical protein
VIKNIPISRILIKGARAPLLPEQELRNVRQELYRAWGETGEMRSKYETAKKEKEEAEAQLREMRSKYETAEKEKEEAGAQLGKMRSKYETAKQEKEEEVGRKRALGRIIRYGTPGVGGFTGGLLLGPIWGPLIGAGLGAGTTLGIQLLQGESPKEFGAYIGPTATGVGTSLVGALLRHIIRKRRKTTT